MVGMHPLTMYATVWNAMDVIVAHGFVDRHAWVVECESTGLKSRHHWLGIVVLVPNKHIWLCRYMALVNQPLEDPTVSDAISRDVGRTFPSHSQFRDVGSVGQKALGNILHAYAALNPLVGYVQGDVFSS